MKNIQIISGAANRVYDVFSATDEQFDLIFPTGTDIAFIDEVLAYANQKELDKAFEEIWTRRVNKQLANGIHGTLFYNLDTKKIYYPTHKDEEVVNPNGSRLRQCQVQLTFKISPLLRRHVRQSYIFWWSSTASYSVRPR